MNCKATSLLSLITFQSLFIRCFALPTSPSSDFQLNITTWNETTDERQNERKLADCIVTQAEATEEYRGGIAAQGVFFTFQSLQDADLLSIEFAVGKDAPQTIPVQIYFRLGSFSGVSGRAEEWQKVADTSAQLSPQKSTGIVPVLNFQTSTLTANTEYALYVSMQTTDTLFAKLSTAGIGAFSSSDGIMERSVGVLVNEGPFPESLASSEIAEFMGVLHYKSKQTCSSVLRTANVALQFAINDIPDTDNLNELAASFAEAVNAIFVTNSTLSDSKRENMINVLTTDANFMGRSDVCPSSYEICALVTASAEIEYLPRVTSGQIQRQLLDQANELANLVKRLSSHSVEIVYVGGSTAALLTALSFEGVPGLMDDTQQRYFQLIYTTFLQEFITDMEIHEVVILSQTQTSRRRALRGMDDGTNDQRDLQSATVSATMIVYGIGGTVNELRALVFDAVLSNQDALIRSLKLEGLRPGFLALEPDINVDPSFFTGLQTLKVAIPDTGSTDTGGGTSSEADVVEGSDDSPSWQIILGALGVTLSSLFLIYRIYKDSCHSDKLDQAKLSDSTSARRATPPMKDYDDGVVDQADFEEVEVVASSRGSRKPDIEEFVDEPPSPAPAKPDIEEVYSSHSSEPPTRGVARSRSLDPSMKLARVNRSPPQQADGGNAARGRSARSISPSRGMGARGMMDKFRNNSQERFRPKSQERLRPKSQERLRPKSQERLRSRSNEGLSRGVDRTQSMDPAGAAQRYLQERNQMMSQSSHVIQQRSQRKNQMMSQSEHDPRMRPNSNRGGRGPGPRPRPRSHDRFQNPNGNPKFQGSGSSLGEKPPKADDYSDSEDSESDTGSFGQATSSARWAAESAPPPPPTSPPPAPPNRSTSTLSSGANAHARFKDNQMALYSPEEGTGLQLVQIVKVQAFKGKTNMPCYKIRLQGSNVEKTMVKETLLMELGEATDASNIASKPTSTTSIGSSAHTPGKKKKKKKKKSMDASEHSTGDMSAMKKKKKKKASSSASPARKMKKTRSFEKSIKPNPAVRRSSSFDSKLLAPARKGSVASSSSHNGGKGNHSWEAQTQQPLFKLPRRTKTPPPAAKGHAGNKSPPRKVSNTPMPPRRLPSVQSKTSSNAAAEDEESVESELGSVHKDASNSQQSNLKPEEINVVEEGETNSSSSEDDDLWDDSNDPNGTGAVVGKNGVKIGSSKEQMKQKASAEKARNQGPESSSEESDLEQ
ncbi:unnamed protein product [Cylindrotheca closterium]|uniref:Uncharacterized protein n=1 Tax=Cylindrotheca closterium TaxID=2856 RepID=A0AAD2FV80_9STRA|nr:unnamed protein product [Cylindrotheca closterium]